MVPDGVKFSLLSKDGDEGYPGCITVSATYTFIQNGKQQADLKLVMTGVLDDDKSSPISLTNHAYFNLAGHDSAEGINCHTLQMDADYFTPTDLD